MQCLSDSRKLMPRQFESTSQRALHAARSATLRASMSFPGQSPDIAAPHAKESPMHDDRNIPALFAARLFKWII